MQPQLIATVIEIYRVGSHKPIIASDVGLREIPPELDPKNSSAFHKEEDSDAEDQKPMNLDFNFCCWYVVDKKQQTMNISILLG